VLLVVFFLAERCRQPLATLRERLHLSARATLLLHFVLELALTSFKGLLSNSMKGFYLILQGAST
ncbi:hypothetical protein, partial [Prevotella brunnea]|uniref:hypothetical protein n=1 Tax=Prevotella brunnea TaxID=2508867 RepID=UPI00283A8FF8